MVDTTEDAEATDAESGSRLLQMVRAVAIKPEDAQAFVKQLEKRAQARHPGASKEKTRDRVARTLVRRYSKMAALVGGASALTGIVPGLGTVVATVGGGAADAVTCMKFQVDMCYCITEAYGYDITSEDAQHLSFLIAAGGTLEKAGVAGGVKIASKAGVRLLNQYLKGAALAAVKEMFKKIGIIFTRKAAEKALPFGIGVVLGSSANYGLTRYVGNQAVKWFRLNLEDGQ